MSDEPAKPRMVLELPKAFKAHSQGRYGKRRQAGVMTATEAAYAAELALMKQAESIDAWEYETLKFKLADGSWYLPDFIIWHHDGGCECVEVKGAGPMNDAAILKMKVVAEKFPRFKFIMAKRRTKKEGGDWTVREF